MSGWEEFDSRGWTNIWGLIIACAGGFRFHHFPQRSWLDALTNLSGHEAPKEKTFFVPKEKIFSSRLIEETGWLKKLLKSSPPVLVIQFRDESENERQLMLQVEFSSGSGEFNNLAEALGA